MSRDHFIPRFILRGFAIDENLPKNKQEIYIFDRKTKTIEKKLIADSFMQIDYNSEETEKYLAYEIEAKVGGIFHNIKKCVNEKKDKFVINKSLYKALHVFLVLMWRRNAKQVENMRKMASDIETYMKELCGNNYEDAINPQYRNMSLQDFFEQHIDETRKAFFDYTVKHTNSDDPTVMKTIKNYIPFIVNNKSGIHFLLHDTYSTLTYFSHLDCDISEYDMPFIMLYPISKTLCLCLMLSQNEIDINQKEFILPIVTWENEKGLKQLLFDNYITDTAKLFVVDDTNKDYLLNVLDK